MLVTSALGKWEVEGSGGEFKLIFSYIANSRPTWATGNPTLKKKKKNRNQKSLVGKMGRLNYDRS